MLYICTNHGAFAINLKWQLSRQVDFFNSSTQKIVQIWRETSHSPSHKKIIVESVLFSCDIDFRVWIFYLKIFMIPYSAQRVPEPDPLPDISIDTWPDPPYIEKPYPLGTDPILRWVLSLSNPNLIKQPSLFPSQFFWFTEDKLSEPNLWKVSNILVFSSNIIFITKPVMKLIWLEHEEHIILPCLKQEGEDAHLRLCS